MSESDNPATEEQKSFFWSLCHEYLPSYSHVWADLRHGSHRDHLTPSIDVPGEVSYSPPAVGPTEYAKRRRTTLGRYLARNWHLTIDPKMEAAIAEITSGMKQHLLGRDAINEEFALLSGGEISEAYKNSVGGNSCMTGIAGQSSDHKNIATIQHWYSMWGDRLRLLVWNKTKGRALYWRDDKGEMFVDRIYGCGQLGICRFQEWARLHKARMIYQSRDIDASVTLGIEALKHEVPYLDSFKYVTEDGIFYNKSEGKKYKYILAITDGNWERASVVECSDCGKIMPMRDGNFTRTEAGGVICARCRDNYYHCANCNDWCRHCGEDRIAGRHAFCQQCFETVTHNCGICESRYWDVPRDWDSMYLTLREQQVGANRRRPTPNPKPEEPICQICKEREFDTCSGCRKEFRKNKLKVQSNGLCGGYYCEGCASKKPATASSALNIKDSDYLKDTIKKIRSTFASAALYTPAQNTTIASMEAARLVEEHGRMVAAQAAQASRPHYAMPVERINYPADQTIPTWHTFNHGTHQVVGNLNTVGGLSPVPAAQPEGIPYFTEGTIRMATEIIGMGERLPEPQPPNGN